jgi:putative sterol carrier protein
MEEGEMAVYQYCTPEWLEELEKVYQADPTYQEQFKKLTLVLCFRVQAESSWGIDKDIIFGTHLDEGRLTRIGFFGEEEARRDATFILAATPQNWKRLLRKETKFVTDFMLGKIKLEQGSKVAILKLAPLSDKLVDFMTSNEIQFPDEMSPDELEDYRSRMEEFRSKLGV